MDHHFLFIELYCATAIVYVLFLVTMNIITDLDHLDGRVSDIFGRRNTLLFANIMFFIGSAMCGASNNLWALVVSRGIAGIGGGGLNTMSSIITSDLVSLRERGKYQGCANVAYAIGSVIGGPLGGLINDTMGWRYCFYMNLPLLSVSLYVSTCLITNYNISEDSHHLTVMEKLKMVDYLGASTIIIGVICFMLATAMGGNSREWSDPLVYNLLIVSIIVAILFCFIEKNAAKTPIMPWSIISTRTPLAASLVSFFVTMNTYIMTYTTPIYFQGLLGYSSADSGLFYLPKVAAISCGSLAAGFWISRTGEYYKFIAVNAFISLLGTIGISTWSPNTSLFIILPCLIADGFSLGALNTSVLVTLLSSCGTKEMATITSVSYLFRSLGGVIGVSSSSAIFQGTLKYILERMITGPNAEEIIDIARKSMTELRSRLSPEHLAIVLETYQVALRYTFSFSVIVCILLIISALFIQQFTLHTKIK
ncbi:major facilitator superfamily domain-containing protein [Pilobolus umbonatus]|nr:major facilitator superfamily domain-containing protein [Pilobolus umbonatus]